MFNNLINLISSSKLSYAKLLINLNKEDLNDIINDPKIDLSLKECQELKQSMKNNKPYDINTLMKYKEQTKKNIKSINNLIKKLDKSSEGKLFDSYKINKGNTVENLKILHEQCENILNTIETYINDSSLKMVNQ